MLLPKIVSVRVALPGALPVLTATVVLPLTVLTALTLLARMGTVPRPQLLLPQHQLLRARVLLSVRTASVRPELVLPALAPAAAVLRPEANVPEFSASLMVGHTDHAAVRSADNCLFPLT